MLIFSIYILGHYCEIDKLIEREQYYIDTLLPLYNILKTAGNSLGYKHSEEAILKMIEAKSGENNPWFGKKGENHTRHGKTLSIESRSRISKANKGENHPFFNRKHSEESREKMAVKASKKVFVYTSDNSTFLYEFSAPRYKDAAKHFKCIPSTISNYVDTNKIFKEEFILSSKNIKN